MCATCGKSDGISLKADDNEAAKPKPAQSAALATQCLTVNCACAAVITCPWCSTLNEVSVPTATNYVQLQTSNNVTPSNGITTSIVKEIVRLNPPDHKDRSTLFAEFKEKIAVGKPVHGVREVPMAASDGDDSNNSDASSTSQLVNTSSYIATTAGVTPVICSNSACKVPFLATAAVSVTVAWSLPTNPKPSSNARASANITDHSACENGLEA